LIKTRGCDRRLVIASSCFFLVCYWKGGVVLKRFSLMIGFMLLFMVGKCQAEELKLDVDRFNQQVKLFEVGRIAYMPEMRVLFYYAPQLSESGVIYDLVRKQALSVGKKGNGPDQFKSFRDAFTDGSYFYLYDIRSAKLLTYTYQGNSTKLGDIIPVKKMGMEFDFGERDFLGKMGDKWIVQNTVYRDLPHIKKSYSKFPITADTYIGTLNADFTGYNQLIQVKGKEYPQICQSYDNCMCRVEGEHYIVQLAAVNFNTALKKMTIPVTHIKTRKTTSITIDIPDKYAYYQPKAGGNGSDWRQKQSKYKYVPKGARFFGLDEQYYFCYFHYNNDESFDILYNVLNFQSMTITQYEQKNAVMKPMIADAENIAFLNEDDPDTCKLVLSPKTVILGSKIKAYE